MINGKDFASEFLGKEFFDLYERLREEYNLVDILDMEGNVRYISNSFQDTLGYDPNELTGKNAIHTLVNPVDLDYVYNGFSLLVKGIYPVEVKYALKKKDGSYVGARSVGLPITQDGKTVGYIVLSKLRSMAAVEGFRTKGRVLLDKAI
jgi:PAS domain S-box-containing protein